MRMASIFKVVRNDCVPSELATPTEQELENAAIDHGIPRQHLGMYVSFVLPKCKQTEEYKSFCDTYYDSSCGTSVHITTGFVGIQRSIRGSIPTGADGPQRSGISQQWFYASHFP